MASHEALWLVYLPRSTLMEEGAIFVFCSRNAQSALVFDFQTGTHTGTQFLPHGKFVRFILDFVVSRYAFGRKIDSVGFNFEGRQDAGEFI